ncbi:hypothetical protein [Rhodococcus opacus]|uniref:hypothetical protein n=1 Tax=Rhodococcus opacus TaxID=37919 RepID=UPI0029556EF9|nr:hypothetical protein [Rhodococcus opacus]MDV7087899.1 hypothetical protein [Rhodococcus opacus]
MTSPTPNVDERRALDVVGEGGVEADVDTAAPVRHRRGMPLNRVPVHGIENSDPVDDRGAVLQQHHSSVFHLSRTRVKPRDVQPREIPGFIGTSWSGKSGSIPYEEFRGDGCHGRHTARPATTPGGVGGVRH